MTAGGVRSSAALCAVTVSERVLQDDIILHLVLKLASPLQVSITVDSKSKTPILNMSIHHTLGSTSPVVLEQRNAILRALIGPALHGALDQSPFHLAGGCASAMMSRYTPFSATTSASVALLTAWMSAAETWRQQHQEKTTNGSDLTTLLSQLQDQLTRTAFLLPTSAQCSLADLDVAQALFSTQVHTSDSLARYPAVVRWLHQTLAVLMDLCAVAGIQEAALAAGLGNPLPWAVAKPPLLFFDGTEDAETILRTLHANSTAHAATRVVASAPIDPASSAKGGDKKNKSEAKDAAKKEKKAQKKTDDAAAKAPEASSKASGNSGDQAAMEYDVSALDIRVGRIVKVWPHEAADKLFCEEIDLGTEQRKIASGLRPFYQASDLQDRLVLVLCNLKKRSLVGFDSHGMVLCASNDDHTQVQLVIPPDDTPLGDRIQFPGYTGAPEPDTKVAKKKIFEKVAPDLRTNAEGLVVWKEAVAQTSNGGSIRALNGMPLAHVA